MVEEVKNKQLNLLGSFANGETKSFPLKGRTLKIGKGARDLIRDNIGGTVLSGCLAKKSWG